ncbi:TRAP transporter substrate-binding protein [Roseovarius aestuarii]|uniref:2,3-diketo-L-gulonate-binding periplasmic protein YiaO n=2 Tax=Roseovarius aestuarii TaxID=475083 RepID=A0A1X7BLE1_9RHOB|nr:TRAP transporter substrate-binding protein [Roseovarius aestuarii]SMC10468.1 2,3-diketo-L-gulonate-binding periplasmic protein YiaO precursor [Roseovarius aestuarii]
MRMKSICKALCLASATALFAQSVAAEKVLKLGTVGFLGMPIGDAIDQALIPTLEEVSGGKMTIEPHYRKSLCSEQSCGEQANQGLLALWTSSTANFGNFGTALAIFDLPYIFKSIEDADRISSEWLAKKQCDIAAEEAGHVCLTVYSSGGFRQLGNAHGPVHVPSDMEGVKWRVTKSPIEYTLVKNWGAVPVPYDWSQLYQGLQTGVVSGQYVATPWQHVAKLHEVAKYFTEIGGSWSGNQLSMDKRQYDALTDEEKEWLHTAAQAFGQKVQELDRAWVEAGETAIKAEITEWYVPTEEELVQWRAGAIDAWLNAKGSFDPETARRVLEEQGMDGFIAQLEEAGAL